MKLSDLFGGKKEERIQFKYHPNLYTDGILKHGRGVCECCGKKVREYIDEIYCAQDVGCVCLACVHDGSAAEKFDAEFVQYAEPVENAAARCELFRRTPGYMAWQGENWLACCGDYCEYLGPVGIKELDERGIREEVLREYASHEGGYPVELLEECMRADGDLTGYLFRCLHCGKYRLEADAS